MGVAPEHITGKVTQQNASEYPVRNYSEMREDNDKCLRELNTLQERTEPQFFHHDHDDFRVPQTSLQSYFSNNSQRQLYSECGEYSFFMRQRETTHSSDNGIRHDADSKSDRCYTDCGNRNCNDKCSDSNLCIGSRFW